jgi:hypothetical protein
LYNFDLFTRRPEISDVAGFTIRRLQANEVKRLHEIWPVSLPEMASRLRRGDWCFVAEDQAGLVHYSWVQLNGSHKIKSAGRVRGIQPKDAWIYHCRTAERAYGRGIYPAVLKRILFDLCGEGMHLGWIYTSLENTASQHGILSAGFNPSEQLRSIRLGKIILPL